ncbi:MAG: hypothetical protein KAR83_09670, partial [Thermodesulfovibrionales bacterium]|nr:hypothetical protein [Thermodesulfovibrionales bacterium]
RWDYSAIGTVPNLAARLCDEAKGGQILISQKTFAGIEDIIEAEPLPKLTLKGFANPIASYNVLSIKE